MAAQEGARALHWVFKIANRAQTIHFYRDVLGMKVLRHEEFDGGCAATCNGPYDNKWSKTMIGWGSEDEEFVFELTYNYGVEGYKVGNDFLRADVELAEGLDRIRKSGYAIDKDTTETIELRAPDGYPFVVRSGPKNRVDSIAIGSSNLNNAVNYWSGLLGMQVIEKKEGSVRVSFNDVSRFVLELVQSQGAIDHATGMGRLAFSYPEEKQAALEKKMIESKQGSIINNLIKLDTPGKATVQVVILGDVDGHEICFVGDTGYRQLSVYDPNGDQLLNEAMASDKSGERKYPRNK